MDEEKEMMDDRVRQHVRCGCSLHIGADAEHIEGCPVIFANRLLSENKELVSRIVYLEAKLLERHAILVEIEDISVELAKKIGEIG